MQDGSSEPVADPPPLAPVMQAIQRFERRSFKTYNARLVAHQRLRARAVAWNASLIATTTASTISAIGLLSEPEMYGSKGATVLASLAVLTLVASLVVASMNYGARTRAMESNYKTIQRLSVAFESLLNGLGDPSVSEFESLRQSYENAIEHSENHTDGDYKKSMKERDRRAWLDTCINTLPYVTLLVPVATLVPFIYWLI